MDNEINEITKVGDKLLNKIEHILGNELTNEEYDEFYKYFNEIRKPNILIDIKDVEPVKKCIEDLQQRIDKAIEILERHTRYSTEELLNILKGEDTNE